MKAISKIEKGTIPVVDVSGFTVGDRYSSIYFSEEALYLKTIDTLHPTIIYKYTDTIVEPIDYALEREKIRNIIVLIYLFLIISNIFINFFF